MNVGVFLILFPYSVFIYDLCCYVCRNGNMKKLKKLSKCYILNVYIITHNNAVQKCNQHQHNLYVYVMFMCHPLVSTLGKVRVIIPVYKPWAIHLFHCTRIISLTAPVVLLFCNKFSISEIFESYNSCSFTSETTNLNRI